MKNTLIVNLIGAPGTGKSTTMAGVFCKLKQEGYDCEMVTEFAKELVWECRNETFKDELYLFAKQSHRLFRVNGKVDIVITDRPLLLTILYNNKYGKKSKELDNLVLSEFNEYNNLNIFLNRISEYDPNGRNQTEKESNEIGFEIENMILKLNDIEYTKMDADSNVVNNVISMIKNKLELI